jgi:hypothetical protein
MIFKSLLPILLLTNTAFSSEIDSYTRRFEINIEDSSEKINLYGNQLIKKVVDNLNDHGSKNGCDETKLYKKLRREFNNHYLGSFSKYITNSSDIDRVKIKTKDSIYSDFNARESFVLGYFARHINDPLGSLIKIKNRVVGTDKFEHFAGTGFAYFKNYYLEKKSIESTLRIGEKAENGILGKLSTGIISYGDLTAEFNGMRFWNHILGKEKDILDEDLGPYISCEKERWVIVKDIDFSQYVDGAWDEAINCSKFKTESMVNKVEKKISDIAKKDGISLSCPIDKNEMSQLKFKYKEYFNRLINSEGHVSKKH